MKEIQTDEAFFEDIYNDTFEGLKRFVQHKSNNPAMVDDILQEVYLEVFRHIKVLREHVNAVGWVYKTAHNKIKKLNEIYNRHSIRETTMEEWNCSVEEVGVMEIIQLDEYK